MIRSSKGNDQMLSFGLFVFRLCQVISKKQFNFFVLSLSLSLSCLVLSGLILSCPVLSCLVLCDSGRMCRVPLFRCVVCLALSLLVLSVVYLLCCLLSPGSWLVSRLSCSSVPVFVGCLLVVCVGEGLRVHQQHAHMFIHVGLVPVHTGSFECTHVGFFSVSHHTAPHHTASHHGQRHSHSDNDTQNSPGPDTARIDRSFFVFSVVLHGRFLS